MERMYKKIFKRLLQRKSKVRYTVTGNGVAHRKSSNYLADPKVKEFLENTKDL